LLKTDVFQRKEEEKELPRREKNGKVMETAFINQGGKEGKLREG